MRLFSPPLRRLLTTVGVAWFCFTALACDSAFSADDVYEENLTIGQGVAGVLLSASDIAGESPNPLSDTDVDVFDGAALVDGALTGDPRATLTSNEDGFFELQLDDGDYVVTQPPDRSVFSSVSVSGAVTRCDFTRSEAGNSWSCR